MSSHLYIVVENCGSANGNQGMGEWKADMYSRKRTDQELICTSASSVLTDGPEGFQRSGSGALGDNRATTPPMATLPRTR